MYKYLIAFVLFMPLVGIWLVEGGEFALSVGVPGEANGATAAFALYAALVLLVAFASGGPYRLRRGATGDQASRMPLSRVRADGEYFHFSRNLIALNLAFLLTMLVGFGGFAVWLGTIEKGLFRATLGPFGALAFLLTKFAIPALFAYATLLLQRSTRSRRARTVWYVNAVLIFVAGSTWGFKTTGVFMLLPGLLILYWNLPFRMLLLVIALFLASLVGFFFLFDAQLLDDADVISFLASRLTILQGDVSWYVYGLHADGEALPDYWPTLLAAAGDTVLSLAGVSRDNHLEWMSYHYDWMLTYLCGAPIENIVNGHSVTGTPFSEGIIAGGRSGIVFFAGLAGLLVGRTYYLLDRSIKTENSAVAAMLSTYFCFHIFSWLNGGAVTQLFHISILVYLAATYVLLRTMSRSPVRQLGRRRSQDSRLPAGQLAL